MTGVGEVGGGGAADVVRTVGLSIEIGFATNTGDVSFTTDDALNGWAGMTSHVGVGFFKVGDVSFTTDDALNGSAGMTVHVGVGSKVGGVKFTMVITMGCGASVICECSFVHGKRFVSTSAAIARGTAHAGLVTALEELFDESSSWG